MASGSEQYAGRRRPKGSNLKTNTPAQKRAPRYSGRKGDTNQDWPF